MGSTGQLVWREEGDDCHHHRHHHHHEDSHDRVDSDDDDDAAYDDRHRHSRRNDGNDNDTQEPDTAATDSDADSELDASAWLGDNHMAESQMRHRHGGKRHHHGNHTAGWASGHGHRAALVKKITSGVMGVLGLLLLLSIRTSWIAVFHDFYTFFFPSCGCRDSASKPADTSYGGT